MGNDIDRQADSTGGGSSLGDQFAPGAAERPSVGGDAAAAIERQIRSERLRQLYTRGGASIPFNFIVAGVAVLVLFMEAPSMWTLGWLFAMGLLTVYRLIDIAGWKKRFGQDGRIRRWRRRFATGALMSGVLWGLGFLILAPQVPLDYQMFILLVLGGMAAGSVVSLSSVWGAYVLYVAPMMAAPVLWHLVQFQLVHVATAALVVAFTALCVWIGWKNSILIRTVISVGLDNEALLEEVEQSNRRLTKANQRLQAASLTDWLLDISNRRHFEESLLREWDRARRHQYPLSCLMIDIDLFKGYNDSHGHLEGDRCLRRLSQTVKSVVQRSSDLLARYGGEELVALLPETPSGAAAQLAEKVREEVEELAISRSGSPGGAPVTVSVGVATMMPGEKPP